MRFSGISRLTASGLLIGLVFSMAAAQDAVPPRGGKGRIQILTTPPKAQAYMGGVNLGLTPVDTAFESGRHTLTLLLNGEELARLRVNVWPDSTTVVQKTLVTPYGDLTLTTRPPGRDCKVYVDGEEVGSTQGAPLNINHLRAGTRIIRVENGGRFREYEVEILPEKRVELLADFTVQ
jgi:hypothetical protein